MKRMEQMRKTTIEQIPAKPGQRLLVVSDIHGHFDRLIRLLKHMNYGGDDILVIVGDLVDKGPESLRVVRYVMELCSRHQVYVSMGNVDFARVQLLDDETKEAPERFAGFLHWVSDFWGESFYGDMLAELGLSADRVTAENAKEYRERLREEFREELAFLRSRPTILTAGEYLFVHGGVPTDDLSVLEGSDAVPYLKNDKFLTQGVSFQRYTVVTGHWPVCLYREDEENNSPIFEKERRIICIDGGCGVKMAGQLNGLLFPDAYTGMEEITWTGQDDFPLVQALDAQPAQAATVHIQYFDNVVEILEENGEMARVRLKSTGREFDAPRKWIKDWHHNGELHCDDYCDAFLEVAQGDMLSVLFETEQGCYVKKRGKLGWYGGRVEKVPEKLELTDGSPAGTDRKWRRLRELETYSLLKQLQIPFQRIDHGEANTMEACAAVDAALGDAVICKNLFLCNQQRTKFYLLMMPGEKKFKTKELSKQIGSARLSFAESCFLERFLHISPGSVSVLGLMNDREGRVQLLIDRDLLTGEWFGCHPCMNTSSLRMRLRDLLESFLPATGHEPLYVSLQGG